ncbi:MAG TPA: type II toxin-antitoxin system VapC family toxin [Chitinophagaceae bacterium]|nr:type II toxin-antitoxin system VapC family toxin [Chitinophagaceae bacterium]
MAFKIILDTNVILDLTLQRSNDYLDLEKIYLRIIAGDFECYTTTVIIQTSSYWLTKERGALQAKKILVALLNDVRIIDASQDIVTAALLSDMQDIEDALQYYTALHHNLDAFISRDKAFIKSATPKLPVYTPSAFIKNFF